jgi:hypothetical protein
VSGDVDAALLILRRHMNETDDPLVVSGLVAKVGALALMRLGFTPAGPAEAKINIGTDDAPEDAQIILTWPLDGGAS